MMTLRRSPARIPATVLITAAQVAGRAPSVHNTQPWRWVVRTDALELYADRRRQLNVSDPVGRLLLVSCGAALHHARTALAAAGLFTAVTRLLDPDRPDHLATIDIIGRMDPSARAQSLVAAIVTRHTDRRPLADAPVAPETLGAIRSAVEGEGAWLYFLRPDQVLEVAIAAQHAQALESTDPDWRTEMAYWASTAQADGLGVPDAVIPSHASSSTVPGRDFARRGTMTAGPATSAGPDRAAVFGILHGTEDTPAAWLRAGEALSAAWLTATMAGVSLVPLSAAVEVGVTRRALRHALSGTGQPYLVLRLGLPAPDQGALPHTPRLPDHGAITLALTARAGDPGAGTVLE
jgi:nitroreductase